MEGEIHIIITSTRGLRGLAEEEALGGNLPVPRLPVAPRHIQAPGT